MDVFALVSKHMRCMIVVLDQLVSTESFPKFCSCSEGTVVQEPVNLTVSRATRLLTHLLTPT